MDELVDFWGAGFEDEGPEVGDGGEDLGALCVGGFGEGVLLLDLGELLGFCSHCGIFFGDEWLPGKDLLI